MVVNRGGNKHVDAAQCFSWPGVLGPWAPRAARVAQAAAEGSPSGRFATARGPCWDGRLLARHGEHGHGPRPGGRWPDVRGPEREAAARTATCAATGPGGIPNMAAEP